MNSIVGFSLNYIEQLNSTLIASTMIKSCNDDERKNLDAINRGRLFSLIGYGFTYAAIVFLYSLLFYPKYIGHFLCLLIPFLFCLSDGTLIPITSLGVYKASTFKNNGDSFILNKSCLNISSSVIYALLHSIFFVKIIPYIIYIYDYKFILFKKD